MIYHDHLGVRRVTVEDCQLAKILSPQNAMLYIIPRHCLERHQHRISSNASTDNASVIFDTEEYWRIDLIALSTRGIKATIGYRSLDLSSRPARENTFRSKVNLLGDYHRYTSQLVLSLTSSYTEHDLQVQGRV